ncbi:MAG: chemotaxis protein MotB [Bradymonadia bacterium]
MRIRTVENGFVEVAIERGWLVFKAPRELLFESCSGDLSVECRAALEEAGTVLARLTSRQFQVEGHTDDVPATRRFASNWELASALTLAVVHVSEESSVAPSNLSTGAFGQSRPLASNATADERALNRGTAIVMVPDMEALFGQVAPSDR